jgi:hypothetical protein
VSTDRLLAGALIVACIVGYVLWELFAVARDRDRYTEECAKTKLAFWISRGWRGPYRLTDENSEDEESTGG